MPETRRLRLTVHTGHGRHRALDSRALLPLGRWSFVAVTIAERVAQIWVNGVLDAEATFAEAFAPTQHPLYVASDPISSQGLRCLLDDLELRAVVQPPEEIEARGVAALGGVGGRSLRFGCAQCTLGQAREVCGEGAHLCTQRELFAGQLTAARSLGWIALSEGLTVWADESVDTQGVTGTALCCRD